MMSFNKSHNPFFFFNIKKFQALINKYMNFNINYSNIYSIPFCLQVLYLDLSPINHSVKQFNILKKKTKDKERNAKVAGYKKKK